MRRPGRRSMNVEHEIFAGEPRDATTTNDDILTRLIKRMDQLEANNSTLITENEALRRKLDEVELRLENVSIEMEDMRQKVAVMRESQLRNASQRVLGITELLERVLSFCPPKQLFSLRDVSHTFRSAIQDLPKLRSVTFTNPRDVIEPGQDAVLRRELQPPLQLNSFFMEKWKTPKSDCSAITLQFKAAPSMGATYWIRGDLSATFSISIGSPQELQVALKGLQTAVGRTYLTLPALPTSVRLTFPDRLRRRTGNEQMWTSQWGTMHRGDVSAIAEVGPATALDMMKVAEILERNHAAGEKDWVLGQHETGWTPVYGGSSACPMHNNAGAPVAPLDRDSKDFEQSRHTIAVKLHSRPAQQQILHNGRDYHSQETRSTKSQRTTSHPLFRLRGFYSVLETPELLEMIILEMEPSDVFRLCRTSRFFLDTIRTSTAISKHLWLKADKTINASSPELNPAVFANRNLKMNPSTPLPANDVRGNMLLVQPPGQLHFVLTFAREDVDSSLDGYITTMYMEKGARYTDLEDLVGECLEWVPKGYKVDCAESIVEIDMEWGGQEEGKEDE
ncbi:hypothetical protein M409DRAFT_53980 [Zasmidium cellare ATCC 36951]|uniref:F-box domain-containing protein n=1 Tax=Zasmidium cellare ATCC 36951 TaxID=1080233 RepID=A0A6A6CPI8_ZASCE|nr:uncharacterized protein M409DRAFT_53980 [Zasmidium cellare ATCC 36951]KAF2167376.1 hypothetical protein M409DRAFT_53980 [Zasmidium cellare ATCC 36951]